MMRLNNLTDLANLLRGMNNDEPTDGMGFYMLCPDYCIGGWVQHCNPELRGLDLTRTVATLLPEALEDDDSFWGELHELCFLNNNKSYAWEATPQQAARAVEILRDTGKCDWDRAMQEVTA